MKSPRSFWLAFLLSAFCFLLGPGCSMTRGVRAPDGTLTVSNWRLLWKTELVDFSVIQPATPSATNQISQLSDNPPSRPFTARLLIGKSNSDEASVGAVTEGAVKGIIGRP